jgi:hypothetical protein
MVATPAKPFPTYSWPFASRTPTKGLLQPPLYYGVLRAMAANQGQPRNSASLLAALQQVEAQTHSHVPIATRIARGGDRNFFRNSGQYWTTLGLLSNTPRIIQLTQLGLDVAAGTLSTDEFASLTVRTFELPNSNLETDWSAWTASGLRIKPFEVILRVLLELYGAGGIGSAYLTLPEFTGVVIPLAGVTAPWSDYADAIQDVRAGRLRMENFTVSGWPNCLPRGNDARIAAEYLRFLGYQGFLISDDDYRFRDQWTYRLDPLVIGDVEDLLGVPAPVARGSAGVASLRTSGAPLYVGRQRKLVEQLARPEQAGFRRRVLALYGSACLLTGETIPAALQAAHLIPVANGGSDTEANGVCLRADVHGLFDAGLIRIRSNGDVVYAASVRASPNYAALPARVAIPAGVDAAMTDWRWNYM